MKTAKIFIIGLLLTISYSVFGQNYIKAVAVKVSDSLDVKLDEYVSNYNHDLTRNRFLDYSAFERANYFISILESTSKSRKMDILECGRQIPRGNQARKAHNELFGNPDFFIESKIPYVKTFRDFKELKLRIESEIMIPSFWQNTFHERKSLEDIIKKSIASHSQKTGSFSGDLLECYKGSKSHHSAIIEDGNGQYGISTVVLVQEEKVQNNWKYSVVIYNIVVFSRPIK
jgi:hypothetical protein